MKSPKIQWQEIDYLSSDLMESFARSYSHSFPELKLDQAPLVNFLNQKFRNLVYETINQEIFQSKSIVDLDLRTSGISNKKKSFMNLEITFFFNKSIDFKSPIIKTEMKRIINSINDDLMKKNEIFSFYLTKNDEKKNL